MTVYVDNARIPAFIAGLGGRWSSVTADSLEELHAFAARLALLPDLFDPETGCYRVREHRRRAAIAAGAVEVEQLPPPPRPAPRPLPAARPAEQMTAQEAREIRERVWTPAIRADHAGRDGCACQFGPSTWCLYDDCERCQAADELPYPETYITNTRSQVLAFAEPYAHPLKSATGTHPHREAAVWLTGRTCRWVCPCHCHSPEAQAEREPAAPAVIPGLELAGIRHRPGSSPASDETPRARPAKAVTIAHSGTRHRGRGDRRRTAPPPALDDALIPLAEILPGIEQTGPRVPRRIQRRRTKGWRLPPGAVIVDRTSAWGNPYRIVGPAGACRVVLLDEQGHQVESTTAGPIDYAHWLAMTRYSTWIDSRPDLVARARAELAGRDLACPCPPDLDCHADVLLSVANRPQESSR